MTRVGAFRRYWRFLQVIWHFWPFVIAVARDRRRYLFFGRRRQPSPAVKQRRADRLVASFLVLGPTFIKLGQLLSTRPDILPPIYIDRLARLQDDVPPAPWEETKAVIEEDLGAIDDHFDAFETTAISGASLGQVYRAKKGETSVAVKVRRPGVIERVEIDLRILRTVVPFIARFLGDAQAFSLENLAEEFSTVIRQEMDYGREREILLEIRSNFADDPAIIIPDVIESHCSDRVLTMEYHGGIKITDVDALDEAGIDRTHIAATLERTYLQMVLEDGVFHADPHPGNISISPDGQILLYDFGMSGRVPSTTREHIISFYLSVAERDIQGILDALIAMGTLSPTADRQLMGEVMELAIEDASGAEVDDWRVQDIVTRVESTMYEFPLRLPAELALILRVATVVEGVCVTLDPDFNFVSVATAFLTERGYREESIRRAVRDIGSDLGLASVSAIRAAPKAERVLGQFERNEAFVRAGIEDPEGELRTLALRFVYALGGAAGLVSSSIVYAQLGIDWGVLVTLSITILCGLLLVRTFRRRRGIRTRPQFTRQNLRQRREE